MDYNLLFLEEYFLSLETLLKMPNFFKQLNKEKLKAFFLDILKKRV